MASFSEKIDTTILPLFLTTYFWLNSSKLSPTRHRTKNRIILANNWCIIEVSMATTGPDMTFLFVYFGLKHPVAQFFCKAFTENCIKHCAFGYCDRTLLHGLLKWILQYIWTKPYFTSNVLVFFLWSTWNDGWWGFIIIM